MGLTNANQLLVQWLMVARFYSDHTLLLFCVTR
jgi:hypothetical protein